MVTQPAWAQIEPNHVSSMTWAELPHFPIQLFYYIGIMARQWFLSPEGLGGLNEVMCAWCLILRKHLMSTSYYYLH